MSKSIDDILRQQATQRQERIQAQQAQERVVNEQRERARQEYLQRMRLNERVFNPSAAASSPVVAGGYLSLTYKTIVDTAWIYPESDVEEAYNILESTITITRSGNDYIFLTLVDLVTFYNAVFNRTAIDQPVGNLGYSLGVGTVLRGLRVELNLKLQSGITVVKWALMKQITNQLDLPSGGNSPVNTIGYGAVYLDWNLDGLADTPSDPSGGGDTDPLRFEVI
jgi:hypothetical protein